MTQHEPIRRSGSGAIPAQDIPDKLYFRIGEVAKMCGVRTYVLRFWETEFSQLHPNKGGTGQRLYRRRDVEMALRIKNLLYDEGYTIPGARQVFQQEMRAARAARRANAMQADAQDNAQADAQGETEPVDETGVDVEQLQSLQQELREIHTMLEGPAAPRGEVLPIRGPKDVSVKQEPVAGPKLVVKRVPTDISKPPTVAEAVETLFDHLEEPLDEGQDRGQRDEGREN